MNDFPYPCTRCGFCCLSIPCPLAIIIHGIGKSDPCPSLSFDDSGAASCALVARVLAMGKDPASIGIGKGCCVKARAIAGGETYDFASLPPETKHGIVDRVRQRTIISINSN